MENQVTATLLTSDVRGYAGRDDDSGEVSVPRQIEALRIPVGTNLADVERWMIFATLQKCGGNKTRAAALLGVSLKTLYNRLNAYRAQGLAMDYGLTTDQGVEITRLTGELTEVPL
jgi:DNA-binding NtrC family response regulator